VQRLEHEAVAAEGDDHPGFLARVLAVAADEQRERRARLGRFARREMDALVAQFRFPRSCAGRSCPCDPGLSRRRRLKAPIRRIPRDFPRPLRQKGAGPGMKGGWR
jgi:hypothetical protein